MSSSDIRKNPNFSSSDQLPSDNDAASKIRDIERSDHCSSGPPHIVTEEGVFSSSDSLTLRNLIDEWYAANPRQAKHRSVYAAYARKAIKIANDGRRVAPECRSWRDLELKVQHIRRLEALKAEGPCYAVVFLLAPQVIADAEANSDPLDWLVDRIRNHLPKALGRKVDWLLFDQRNEADKLHLHGLIGISEDEIPRAKEALHRALGRCDWPFTPQFLFKRNPELNRPNSGWIGYCLDGQDARNRYSSTQSLTRKAKTLHEKLHRTSGSGRKIKTYLAPEMATRPQECV